MRNRRLLEAADLQFRAGDPSRARDLLEQARAAAPPGNERAAVLAQLAYIEPSPIAAIALCREALAEAEGDDALQATIHLNLAGLMRFGDGIESGLEHGRLAVLAASRVDDVALRCRALAAHGLLHFNAGRDIPATMEEALSLERSLPGWPLADGPAICLRAPALVVGRRGTCTDALPGDRCMPAKRETIRSKRRVRAGISASSSGGPGTGTRPTGTRPSR